MKKKKKIQRQRKKKRKKMKKKKKKKKKEKKEEKENRIGRRNKKKEVKKGIKSISFTGQNQFFDGVTHLKWKAVAFRNWIELFFVSTTVSNYGTKQVKNDDCVVNKYANQVA